MLENEGEEEGQVRLLSNDISMLEEGDMEKLDKTPERNYGLVAAFRFGSIRDILLFVGGLGAAFVFGGVTPMTIQLIGKMLGGGAGADPHVFADRIAEVTPKLIKLGGVSFATGFLQVFLLGLVAERLLCNIKRECLRSLLRQEVSYFDGQSAGSLSTLFAQQTQNLLKGISDSIGQGAQSISMMGISFFIGFHSDIRIAEVLMLIVPVLMVVIAVLMVVVTKRNRALDKANEEGGGVAEEYIGGIQTVSSFCGEKEAIEKYDVTLTKAEKLGVFMSTFVGGFMVFFLSFLYGMFGVAYWYGSGLIAEGKSDFGKIYTTVFSCTMGAVSIAGLVPCFQGLAKARIAINELYKVIDRQPKMVRIDTSKPTFDVNTDAVAFHNVCFRYPDRKSYILNRISFSVRPGQMCALVGQSGCGKSTCIQLLERFYDVSSGKVTVFGRDVQTISSYFLREIVALVSQEPVLFAKSIKENIWFGMEKPMDEAQIVAAARKANAHEFITNFRDGYNTQCGSMGTQLSGGQKQRIAIARALVRNPQIILLDEATSALDYESERVVQEAIDRLLSERSITSIVIAHRLSTIKHADKIVVFEKGDDGALIAEQGTHEELMKHSGGVYRSMVEAGETAPTELEPDTELLRRHSSERFMTCDSSPPSPGESFADSVRAGLSAMSFMASAEVSHTNSQDDAKLTKRDSHESLRSISGGYVMVSPSPTELADEEEPLYEVERTRLWAESAKYWKYLALGIVAAGIAGGANPLTSIILSDAMKGFIVIPLSNFQRVCHDSNDCRGMYDTCWKFNESSFCSTFLPDHGPSDVKHAGHQAFLLYLAIGIVMGFARGINVGGFGYVSQKLTHQLKYKMFSSYMRMDAAFYDKPSNQVGVLVSRLATDPILVQNVTGDYYAQLATNFFGIVVAFSIAFFASWKFTLVVLVPCCLFALSTFLNIRRDAAKKVEVELQSGKVLNQALNAIRTVYSCNAEDEVMANYEEFLQESKKSGIRTNLVAALSNGFAQFAIQGVFAFSYWYGSKLVEKGILDPPALFKVVSALQSAGQSVGASFARANDTSKADVAISNIYRLLDDQRAIDYSNPEGVRNGKLRGNIEFLDVSFAYPMRPRTMVLKNFTCNIKAGETVAFVGASGSGKSSIVRLLERFYDPSYGRVFIDGRDITSYQVSYLRRQLGLVGQEPILFKATLLENICYGMENEFSNKDSKMIAAVNAAKSANAHDFIMDFPEGYNTNCGTKGAELSGGQKQRIAIARALMRNPSILLLDEATSALDNESEQVVQEALDRIMKGRTTISVAHRLSTIQNADQIIVLERGVVVERGTHARLIGIPNGHYRKLYEMSSGYTSSSSKKDQ